MENNIQIFDSPKFGKVRTVILNDEPWFVGKDVAQILGYSNTNKAIQVHVDKEDKFLRSKRGSEMGKLFSSIKDMQENLGRQDNWFINESGIYSLVFGSKISTAKQFKHWVTSEVLPSIRKTGKYEVRKMTDDEIVGQALMIQTRRLEEANKKIKELAPKAEFYDAVANSKSLLSMNEVAKILDMGIGRNKLFEVLRRKKVLDADNVPYQRYVDKGYFKLVESYYINNGTKMVSKTTKVKQSGLEFIRRILKKMNGSFSCLDKIDVDNIVVPS